MIIKGIHKVKQNIIKLFHIKQLREAIDLLLFQYFQILSRHFQGFDMTHFGLRTPNFQT